MPGGAYSALSGMRTRLEELDRLAADLANVGTAGYKTERTSTEDGRGARFRHGARVGGGRRRRRTKTDFTPGTIATTGRDLDVAIEGRGFFDDRDARRHALHAQRQLQAPGRRRADDDGRRAGARRQNGAIMLPAGPLTRRPRRDHSRGADDRRPGQGRVQFDERGRLDP